MIVACPKCDFRPTPNILWICRPGCGTKWHTFSPHGICPGCHKFWHDTCCPRCRMWSPHDDWYQDEVPDRQARSRLAQPKEQEEPSGPVPSNFETQYRLRGETVWLQKRNICL